MTRVMLVGLHPDAVDYTDPALPPGMNAGKISAGIQVALTAMQARGWDGSCCLIRPDETAVPTLESALAAAPCDCVVIGAGVRLPPKNLALLETLVNAVRRNSPATAIAFNIRPDDTAEAAARCLPAAPPPES